MKAPLHSRQFSRPEIPHQIVEDVSGPSNSPAHHTRSLFIYGLSAATAANADVSNDSGHVDDDSYLSTTPTLRCISLHKPQAIPRVPVTVAEPSSPLSDLSPRSWTLTTDAPRHSFHQLTSTLPPYHPTSPIPLPRSRSRSFTDLSSSLGSESQLPQQHGMGHKVAASLDLFQETISPAKQLNKPSIPLVSPTKRRVSSRHHPQTSAEPEFLFFNDPSGQIVGLLPHGENNHGAPKIAPALETVVTHPPFLGIQ